jgi:hypothetical protein
MYTYNTYDNMYDDNDGGLPAFGSASNHIYIYFYIYTSEVYIYTYIYM